MLWVLLKWFYIMIDFVFIGCVIGNGFDFKLVVNLYLIECG